MDYFSVIVLIIVVFIFMADRKTKTLEQTIKENSSILEEVENVKQNMKIITIDSKDMNYDKLFKSIQEENLEVQYIFIQNNEMNLTHDAIDTLIANYVVNEKRPCGFNLIYSYNEKKWSIKKIYVDIINYLNIFNRQELSTYGIIILKKEDDLNNEKRFKENLISYTANESTNVNFSNKEIKKDKLKRIYVDKLNRANISIIIKMLLLIFSGSIITTNLIYSILNVNNNINAVIIALVIYYCYSYIIRYIYIPIGKQRVIASYIFPIYFIAYIIVSIYTLVSKVINKVHAS